MKIYELKKAGCRFTVVGGQLVIDNIPDWQTYRYCVENFDKLMLVATTENVLGSFIGYQKAYDKCAHCKWRGGNRCPFGEDIHRIPAKMFQDGCERWVESKSIYF